MAHTQSLEPPAAEVRTESDSIGTLAIPADAYWGINTARALENFPISGRPISVYPDLIGRLRLRQAGRRARQRRHRRVGAGEGRPDRRRV